MMEAAGEAGVYLDTDKLQVFNGEGSRCRERLTKNCCYSDGAGAGFSGSFTTYGVTVAVNGAAVPAGSAVLYSGQSLIIAFDPWSLAIAVVIYIVMSMSSCNEEEGKLAMKEGARLCHTIGTWCSSCFRLLGKCVSCTEHTTSKCCFNSKLSRIVNEQGRTQIGKPWGGAQTPDCSGFTV